MCNLFCLGTYFGYKLVVLATWVGVPIAYDLVPAHSDERQAAEGVLEGVRGCHIYGDKGFIGSGWQQEMGSELPSAASRSPTGNHILTLKRVNQHQQHSPQLNRFISRIRQPIEGVFHEIQNTGRNPEGLLNKTVEGLCVHIAAKMASHTLGLLLRRHHQIEVLTFSVCGKCLSAVSRWEHFVIAREHEAIA